MVGAPLNTKTLSASLSQILRFGDTMQRFSTDNDNSSATRLRLTPLAMPRHSLAITALALALAILGVLGYKLSPRLFSRADISLAPIRCNPAELPCSAALPDGGRLVLTATPRPIRPLQTFRLAVRLIDSKAERVEVDFDGVDMRMGLNRVRLAPPTNAKDYDYSGQAMLPVCVSASMLWAATVIIETKDGQIAIPFHFEVAAR